MGFLILVCNILHAKVKAHVYLSVFLTGEEHYNCISALHKSMRGSHENASLYWLGRMLEGGEDPLYVARRLVRFASEDVGMRNYFMTSSQVLRPLMMLLACCYHSDPLVFTHQSPPQIRLGFTDHVLQCCMAPFLVTSLITVVQFVPE